MSNNSGSSHEDSGWFVAWLAQAIAYVHMVARVLFSPFGGLAISAAKRGRDGVSAFNAIFFSCCIMVFISSLPLQFPGQMPNSQGYLGVYDLPGAMFRALANADPLGKPSIILILAIQALVSSVILYLVIRAALLLFVPESPAQITAERHIAYVVGIVGVFLAAVVYILRPWLASVGRGTSPLDLIIYGATLFWASTQIFSAVENCVTSGTLTTGNWRHKLPLAVPAVGTLVLVVLVGVATPFAINRIVWWLLGNGPPLRVATENCRLVVLPNPSASKGTFAAAAKIINFDFVDRYVSIDDVGMLIEIPTRGSPDSHAIVTSKDEALAWDLLAFGIIQIVSDKPTISRGDLVLRPGQSVEVTWEKSFDCSEEVGLDLCLKGASARQCRLVSSLPSSSSDWRFFDLARPNSPALKAP